MKEVFLEICGHFATLEDAKVQDGRVDDLWEQFVQNLARPDQFRDIRDKVRNLVDELVPEVAP